MAHYKGAASEAGRAMQLMKKREQQLQDNEIRKKKIEEDLKINNIENKFAVHYDAVEQQLKVLFCPRNMLCYLKKCVYAEFNHWFGNFRRNESKTGEHCKGKREKIGSKTGRKRTGTPASIGS